MKKIAIVFVLLSMSHAQGKGIKELLQSLITPNAISSEEIKNAFEGLSEEELKTTQERLMQCEKNNTRINALAELLILINLAKDCESSGSRSRTNSQIEAVRGYYD